jgi:hypothetical protein
MTMNRPRPPSSGLFVALLALVMQLVSAAVPAWQGDAAVSWPGAGVICHADDASAPPVPDQPGRQPGHHHATDCLVCPLCAAVAQSALPLAGGLALPLPSRMLLAHAGFVPPATAPPARSPAAAQPRGPPALA